MGASSSKATGRKLPTKLTSNLTKPILKPKLGGSLPASNAFSRDRVDPKQSFVPPAESTKQEQAQLFEHLKKFNQPIESAGTEKEQISGQSSMISILRNRKFIEGQDKAAEENDAFGPGLKPSLGAKIGITKSSKSIPPIELNDLIRKGYADVEPWNSANLASHYNLPQPTVELLLKHLKPCTIIQAKE